MYTQSSTRQQLTSAWAVYHLEEPNNFQDTELKSPFGSEMSRVFEPSP